MLDKMKFYSHFSHLMADAAGLEYETLCSLVFAKNKFSDCVDHAWNYYNSSDPLTFNECFISNFMLSSARRKNEFNALYSDTKNEFADEENDKRLRNLTLWVIANAKRFIDSRVFGDMPRDVAAQTANALNQLQLLQDYSEMCPKIIIGHDAYTASQFVEKYNFYHSDSPLPSDE